MNIKLETNPLKIFSISHIISIISSGKKYLKFLIDEIIKKIPKVAKYSLIFYLCFLIYKQLPFNNKSKLCK